MKGNVTVLGKYVWLLLFLTAGFILCSLCSCKTIPIETVREVYINRTDTFVQHDTTNTVINTILREARPEDSAMIAELGIRLNTNERLLILMQKQLQEKSKETLKSKTDTFIKIDSIPVPVPVEKEVVKIPKIYTYSFVFSIFILIFALIKFVRWLQIH